MNESSVLQLDNQSEANLEQSLDEVTNIFERNEDLNNRYKIFLEYYFEKFQSLNCGPSSAIWKEELTKALGANYKVFFTFGDDGSLGTSGEQTILIIKDKEGKGIWLFDPTSFQYKSGFRDIYRYNPGSDVFKPQLVKLNDENIKDLKDGKNLTFPKIGSGQVLINRYTLIENVDKDDNSNRPPELSNLPVASQKLREKLGLGVPTDSNDVIYRNIYRLYSSNKGDTLRSKMEERLEDFRKFVVSKQTQ